MLDSVKKNVRETIGVPFEVIGMANSGGAMSISKAYNLAGRQGKFDILCFMHEDLRIHTENWGVFLQKILQDRSIGLVGIAGSISRADFPTLWGSHEPHLRTRLIQHDQHGVPGYIEFNPKQETLADVGMVDGCWMACRREVWENHPFDEETFKGFHLYDEDFSFQISGSLRVCVTFEILVEHFSPGRYSREWFAAAEIFHRKWKHRLPVLMAGVDRKELMLVRQSAFEVLRSRLLGAGYSRKELALTAIRYPQIMRQYLGSTVSRAYSKRKKAS